MNKIIYSPKTHSLIRQKSAKNILLIQCKKNHLTASVERETCNDFKNTSKSWEADPGLLCSFCNSERKFKIYWSDLKIVSAL